MDTTVLIDILMDFAEKGSWKSAPEAVTGLRDKGINGSRRDPSTLARPQQEDSPFRFHGYQ